MVLRRPPAEEIRGDVRDPRATATAILDGGENFWVGISEFCEEHCVTGARGL